MPTSTPRLLPSLDGLQERPSHSSSGHAGESSLRVHEGRADCRGYGAKPMVLQQLDHGRDPLAHPRGQKEPVGQPPGRQWDEQDTVDQLKERAMELGYHLPPYATKGTIMRILRDQNGMGPSSILGFGSYRTWALKEVNSHDNPSEDLVMFANWWQGELHRWRETPLSRASPSSAAGYLDPEENATIPYIEDASSTTSWDMVTKETLNMTRPKSKAAPAEAPRTPPRRRPFEKDGALAAHMEQDIPAEVNDEVRYLEERLAVLNNKHGLPPGSQ